MSHLLKSAKFQWACWYSPELLISPFVAGGAAVVFGGSAALVGLLGPAAVGVQEAGRLISNARVRHARADRTSVSPESAEATTGEATRQSIEAIPEPQAWVDEDGDAVVIGTHDVELATKLMVNETGEPVSHPGQPCWVVVDVDEAGQSVGWRFVEAGTAHAIPACGW